MPRSSTRHQTVPGAAAVAVVVVAMILVVLRPVERVGDVPYLVGLAAATGLTWHGVVRRPPDERAPWAWVAAAVTLTMAADVTFQILVWVDGEPDVSIADVPWIAAYAALAVGLLELGPPLGEDREAAIDTLIDTLVALVVAFLVVWVTALDDVVADTSVSPFVRGVWAAYPILDVIILSLVARLLLSAARSRALLLVAGGSVAWLVADLGYLVGGGTVGVPVLNLAWMTALLLVGLAAMAREPASADATPRPAPVLAERSRMWLVLAPLAVPVALMLWGQVRHEHPNTPVMLGASIALIALAGARAERLLKAVEAAQREVEDREHLYRALAANASDAVFVADAEGRFREGQESLARLLDLPPDQLDGASAVAGRLTTDDAELGRVLDAALAAPGEVFEHLTEVQRPDGSRRWLHARVVNMFDDPVVDGLVANVQDVTDRKRADDELRHQAFHDGLTGLANRSLLVDRIGQAVRRGARRGTDPVVIYLDVDEFKSVNDRFGHDGGDRLLVAVAERLTQTVRTEDTVARLGGDEFAVLIEENHVGAREAFTTAERILQALSHPFTIEGQAVTVSASLGVAVGGVGSNPDELLRSADIAMYRAKAAGKACMVEFDEAMGEETGEALRLEAELGVACAQGELALHYQAVIDLRTDRVVGFEALLRWEHPRLGLVPPDRFIPLAEDTGLIVPIGRWVLETACATAARWRRDPRADHDLTMAVNLSARQLGSDEIVHDVRGALAASGLDPHALVLEMTETTLVADPAAAAERLVALKALGVRIAIDDFGTGYSSLAYLRQFPIDILKIDRSFVETITDADELPPIVRGLLDLGHTLDLEIVAEGIEEHVQRDGLRRARCTFGQGYLFARPLPRPDAERLLARARPVPSPDPQAG